MLSQSPDPLKLPICRACPEDAPAILVLLKEAAAWLWDRGIHQWHPDGFTLAEVQQNIARYEVYVVMQDGTVLGTCRLQWTDPIIWGKEVGTDGKAGYVHQFAIARAASGCGLGERLLRFAEEQVAAQNLPFLRLDCWAGNKRLCQYYADAGFIFRGERAENDTWLCALWERPVAQSVSVP